MIEKEDMDFFIDKYKEETNKKIKEGDNVGGYIKGIIEQFIPN